MDEAPVLDERKECMDLPPGFRFHPTDEEIITYYLTEKVMNYSFSSVVIGEVDLNKCEPWDLPSKAKMGEKEWYFFCHKDRKYPTGMRTNRATEAGYWKATGKDKEIFRGRGLLVGMKKTLVFYKGRAPKGEKTNWVMHEFRLEGNSPSYYNLPRGANKDAWAVCRVFHKTTGMKKSPMHGLESINSFGDGLLDSPILPPLMDIPQYMNSSMSPYYTMMGIEDPQDHHKTFMANNDQVNPSIYLPQGPAQSPYFSIPRSADSGYLHQNQAMVRDPSATSGASTVIREHCKAEQLSNNSTVSISHDTGLSTDWNIEISSVISKHNSSSSRPQDDLGSPTADLDNFWNY